MKKGLSLLLALCMMLVLIPALPAQADEAIQPVSLVSVGELPRPVPDGAQTLQVDASVDVDGAFDRAEVVWYDLGTNEFATEGVRMEAGETFIAGHRAYAIIRVFLNPGASFAQKTYQYGVVYLGSVEMEDRQSQSVLLVQNQGGQEYIELRTLPYNIDNDVLITEISVDGLSLGSIGETPDSEITVSTAPENALKQAQVQWWHDGAVITDFPMYDGYYKVRLYLYFQDGYYPCDPEFRYKGTLNVPGWEVDWAKGANTSGAATCLWVELRPRLLGQYTVKLEPGEGSGAADPIVVTGDEDVLAPRCPFFAPQGKLFDHWEYTIPNGSRMSVSPMKPIPKQNLNGNELTLTAVYVRAAMIDAISVLELAEPAPGQLPDFDAVIETNQNGAVQSAAVEWYQEGSETPLGPEDAFLASENYYCELTVALNWGYLPQCDPADPGEDAVFTGDVLWDSADPERDCLAVQDQDGNATMMLRSAVFCLDADVSGLVMPFHGKAFDFEVELGQTDLVFEGLAWYCPATGSWMTPEDTALAGETYQYVIALQPVPEEGGGRFPQEAGRFLGNVSLNGEPLTADSVRILEQTEPFGGTTAYAGSMLIQGEYTAFAFEDVRVNDWYADAVYWALDAEVTNGTNATHFSPKKNCTRAQIVTFLWRAFGAQTPASTENPFVDVPEEQYYTDAVLWAVEKGITKGVDATHFNPNGICNRGQAVTFLWRAAGSPAPTTEENPFTDVQPGRFYSDAVLWAVGEGITNGTTATTFTPSKNCNRGTIVTFLYRFFENSVSVKANID